MSSGLPSLYADSGCLRVRALAYLRPGLPPCLAGLHCGRRRDAHRRPDHRADPAYVQLPPLVVMLFIQHSTPLSDPTSTEDYGIPALYSSANPAPSHGSIRASLSYGRLVRLYQSGKRTDSHTALRHNTLSYNYWIQRVPSLCLILTHTALRPQHSVLHYWIQRVFFLGSASTAGVRTMNAVTSPAIVWPHPSGKP